MDTGQQAALLLEPVYRLIFFFKKKKTPRSEILASLDHVTAYSDAGYKQFMFSDEAISPSSLNLIADEIAKRGLQIKWACRSKMERAHTPDMFRRLRQSGCFEILFGLETISPRILILMDKSNQRTRRGRLSRDLSRND